VVDRYRQIIAEPGVYSTKSGQRRLRRRQHDWDCFEPTLGAVLINANVQFVFGRGRFGGLKMHIKLIPNSLKKIRLEPYPRSRRGLKPGSNLRAWQVPVVGQSRDLDHGPFATLD
jgi:hypothetical protein